MKVNPEWPSKTEYIKRRGDDEPYFSSDPAVVSILGEVLVGRVFLQLNPEVGSWQTIKAELLDEAYNQNPQIFLQWL